MLPQFSAHLKSALSRQLHIQDAQIPFLSLKFFQCLLTGFHAAGLIALPGKCFDQAFTN